MGGLKSWLEGLRALVYPSDQTIHHTTLTFPTSNWPTRIVNSLQLHVDTWVTHRCTVSFIQTILSYQVLYPVLPGLLDCNPFRESPDPQVTGESARVLGSSGLQVPGEIQQIVEVLTETWRLLSDCHLHPEISSQLIGYLFYFINASLFNSLMERGISIRTCTQGINSGHTQYFCTRATWGVNYWNGMATLKCLCINALQTSQHRVCTLEHQC